MAEIYFDNAASTVVYKEAVDKMNKYMLLDYANPSSLHKKGGEAAGILDEARENVLKLLGLKNRRVIFTSGASESINTAIKGTILKYSDLRGINIVTTNIEHPATAETFKFLEQRGLEVRYLKVNNKGQILKEEIAEKIDNNTRLVSIIYVNNEFGVKQNLGEIIKDIKEINSNVLVHIDAVQAVGKIKLDLNDADMISISAHKFHGPKGIGALIIKENITLVPLIHGGGQQDKFRSGTIPTVMIAGLSEAARISCANFENNYKTLKELFDYFVLSIKEKSPYVKINTPLDEDVSARHIISLSVPGIKSEVLLHMLEEDDIFVSTSSACSSRDKKHKSVLLSIGLSEKEREGTIRISFSAFNTKDQIDFFLEKFTENTNRLLLLNRRHESK